MYAPTNMAIIVKRPNTGGGSCVLYHLRRWLLRWSMKLLASSFLDRFYDRLGSRFRSVSFYSYYRRIFVFCRTSCLYKPRCHYVACREKDTDPGTDTSDAGDPQQNLHWHLPPANTHSFSSESGNKFLKYAYICRYIYQLYKFRVSAPLLKLSAHRTASFTRGDHPRAGVACLSRRNTFYLFFSQRYYGREKILRPPNLSNPEEVRCIFIILNGNDTAQDTTSDRDAYVIGDRFLAL